MGTYLLINLSGLAIGLIVGGVLLALAAIAILLYFFFFQHMRSKAQAKELIRRFEYLHSLLIGQDAHWVKQLERIASTNLLFVARHQSFEKRFKDIRDKGDAAAQKAINDLKDMLEEHSYKQLKAALPEAKRVIDEFDAAANSLHNDLHELILPEEECNEKSLHMKEQFRAIKQDYALKQGDLSLCRDSFQTVFAKLDDLFDKFASLVDSAQYEEARQLIPNVEKVLSELSRALSELPNICVSIEHVIPDKLLSLQAHYEEMRSSGYPLQHLLSKGAIDDLQNELDSIAHDVKSFHYGKAQTRLDAIQAAIDGYLEGFEKEKDCRVAFESRCDQVYDYSTSVEKKFTRLCNALPNVERIYVIAAEQNENVNRIKSTINKMGATKRFLDNLIHSLTKQPYSALVEKMNELEEEAKENEAGIEDFNRYLVSLKTDSEAALSKVVKYHKAILDAEFTLREMGLPALTEKYEKDLESCLKDIDSIYSTLHTTPIDVAKVNEAAFDLTKVGDEALSGVKRDYEGMVSTDAAITYANRDRFRLSDLDAQLKQAEEFYRKGEFDKAYEDVTASLRRLRGE